MNDKLTGQYTTSNTFSPDMNVISDDYWTSLNKTITAEVNRSFPTCSDLKETYYVQLIGLWLVAASSAITYAIVRIVLH